MDADQPSLLVTLPARPRYLALVRRVIASFGRYLGMAEPGIGDLKTVVSEACALAIGSPAALGGPVRVEASRQGSELAVVVRDGSSRIDRIGENDGDGAGLGLQLISTLSSRFQISESSEGGREIRVCLPLGGEAGSPA